MILKNEWRKEMIIEYVRLRKDVIPPDRGNPSDAGMDVYFNPEDAKSITLAPGQSERFQTGLRFGIPHGYMLQVMNRSSVAAKKNLLVGAHVVDSGYDGEVFVDVHNVGTTPQIIGPHVKIAQVVLIPIVPFRALETSSGNLYEWYPITISDRGEGSLGSTGE
jgi:dUTP pyrophosphatase